MEQLKNKIIEIGRLMWDKNLVTGFNGNISARVDTDTFLITATGKSLGYLTEQDIVLAALSGEVLGKASSEKLMHTDIYKNFPQAQAVVHTHPTYTNGFFLTHEAFAPKTFEAKFYLGEVKAIFQDTPSVTDTASLIQELRANNIVVLKNHGVVAMGMDLFGAFVLIQELEEQVKMDLAATCYGNSEIAASGFPIKTFGNDKGAALQGNHQPPSKKYKLFSKEQIEEIVRLVNNDSQMKELGLKTAMNMELAVCLQETGDIYSFTFESGRITKTGKDASAEFLITANKDIWRAVFNREIDPFVATTQKKMGLRGDFARISKWYAPCCRIFQLWTKVPVE